MQNCFGLLLVYQSVAEWLIALYNVAVVGVCSLLKFSCYACRDVTAVLLARLRSGNIR